MYQLFLLVFLWLYPVLLVAEDPVLERLFSQAQAKGTIVLMPLKNDQGFVYNNSRAEQRYPCASTFKILNTLIAVQEKIVDSKDDVFKWDGVEREISAWNRNQTLESAFRSSCVWCFQSIARKVRENAYRKSIKEVGYGKLTTPFKVDSFWLDGALKISTLEQIQFLKKVYLRQLPFEESAYEILSQIMILEQKDEYTLRAKTGWATNSRPGVGWFVGYIESDKDVWFFALNMDLNDPKKLPLRQKLVYDSLRIKQIIQ